VTLVTATLVNIHGCLVCRWNGKLCRKTAQFISKMT